MSKTLTLGAIKKENAKYRETKRIQLDSKNHLDVNTKFDPDTKELAKAEFIKVIFDKLLEITNNSNVDGEFDNSLYEQASDEYLSAINLIGIQIALIIKHFTSLEIDATTYEDYVKVMSELGKYDYTEAIIEALGKEERDKLFAEFTTELDKANNKIIEEVEKLKAQNQNQATE